MDKRFLHKVVGQLIRETEIDRYKKKVYFPFLSFDFSFFLLFPTNSPYDLSFSLSSTSIFSFFKHCREIYGLTDDEIDYVWNEYINSITYLIKNG